MPFYHDVAGSAREQTIVWQGLHSAKIPDKSARQYNVQMHSTALSRLLVYVVAQTLHTA